MPIRARQPDRRAGVVGEDQEGAGIGDHPAVQRHAVHRRRHAVLAHAVVDVAAGVVGRVEGLHALDEGVVGAGEVGRAADHLRRSPGSAAPAPSRSARGWRWRASRPRTWRCRRRSGSKAAVGQVALHGAVELGLAAVATPFSRFSQRLRRSRAPWRPALRQAFGTSSGMTKGSCGQPRFSRVAATSALPSALPWVSWCAFQVGRALADLGLAGDQASAGPGASPSDRAAADLRLVVAVDRLHRPARGLEAGQLVAGLREVQRAVDGDVVVVPQHGQPVQLQPAGQADRLVADRPPSGSRRRRPPRCGGRPGRRRSGRPGGARPWPCRPRWPGPGPAGRWWSRRPAVWPYSGWPAVLEPSWRKSLDLLHRSSPLKPVRCSRA